MFCTQPDIYFLPIQKEKKTTNNQPTKNQLTKNQNLIMNFKYSPTFFPNTLNLYINTLNTEFRSPICHTDGLQKAVLTV